MLHIATEADADSDEVEALFDLSFAPGRTALSSYRLRAEAAAVRRLCLIARDDYWVAVAAIRYWPILICPSLNDPSLRPLRSAAAAGGVSDLSVAPEERSACWPALLLGPIAVHPTRQGEGLGAELIERSLATAREHGWRRVVLVGDAPYYARFGFSQADQLLFPPPTNPARILAKELVAGGLDGVSGVVRRWGGPTLDIAAPPDPAAGL